MIIYFIHEDPGYVIKDFFGIYKFPLTFATEKDRKEGNGNRSLFIYPVPVRLCFII